MTTLRPSAVDRDESTGSTPPSQTTDAAGGAEMAALIGAMDWSHTPLGPAEAWSPSLQTMVSFMLANRFPLLLWWGPEYVSIYNDAYRPVLGAKHPWGLGKPGRECWSEIWDVLKPLVDAPFRGGPATWIEDLFLEINRHGFVEETHFTVAYSPVPDPTVAGGIGGVLATVHEITDKVVGERRVTALRDLASRSGQGRTVEETCTLALDALANDPRDVPFALIYLFDDAETSARLVYAVGAEIGDEIAPQTIALDAAAERQQAWPLAEALRSNCAIMVGALKQRFNKVPAGPWSDPPRSALLVPLKSSDGTRLRGVLVGGLSSRSRADDQYRSFFDLVASQIAAAMATARAYQEAQERADALAEIDRAKTAFFSNVSHEFRTPLTLMLGPLTDALANSDLPEAERERLDLARRNAVRLLKLVNSLLDFSRIEAGRAQASYEPTDLASFTAELASNFRSACERAGLRLMVDCPPLPESVHVDRAMWEKIVLNLLSNAFKFTFEGEIEVALRSANGSASLTIRDTGVGIPDEELPHLFERFHRIEGQKSRTYEGSGIGLALVQELVKLHGGAIRADSRVGLGTSFTVSVPLERADIALAGFRTERTAASAPAFVEAYLQEALSWLPDSSPPASSAQTPADTPAALAGARILVADDNSDMRAYVCRLLGPACEVEAVADGEAALRQIRARRPDLVITDAMMPNLDGLALVRALREDPALQDLPIVMLSARAGEEASVEGRKAGVDDYLVKPFSARELIARVAATLKLSQARREAAAALRQSEGQLRAYLATSFDAIYRMSADWSVMQRLEGKQFIADTAEPSGAWLDKYIHPDDQAAVLAAIDKAIRAKSIFALEHRVLRTDNTLGWTASRAVPLLDDHGEIVEWLGTAADITERKRHEERQQMLLNELNHRVKNTLAAVHSIAVQTLRNSSDTVQAREMIGNRLAALAKAHDVLTRERWEGAFLKDVARQAVGPHLMAGSQRVKVEGPKTWLPPKFALALSLAFHELCTNAAKYGALSNEDGHIKIEWRLRGLNGSRQLEIRWAEFDGPPVRPRSRQGFGSRLIERGLRQDLDGEVTMDFAASGVVCTIHALLPATGGATA